MMGGVRRGPPGWGSGRWSLVAVAVLAAQACLLAVWALAAGAASSSLLEAEEMRAPSGKVFDDAEADGQKALLLRSNETASATFSGSADRVVVRARGDQCRGAPRMVVKIDGSVVMSELVNSGSWASYGADVEVKDGDHSVEISYTNDRRTRTCDRNLRLDSAAFESSTPEPVSGPLPALSVSGNHLVQEGRPGAFYFHGVNRDTLEWGENNWGGCGGDGHFTDQDYANIAAWGANAVRIPLSQANWLGRRCDQTGYARMVDDAVAKANAHGMYAILDLHWSDVGGEAPCDGPSCRSGQQPMPDPDSLVFWEAVAARYADNPGVVFDLYNEPYIYKKPFVYNPPDEESWKCWRDGGCTVYASEQTSPKEPDPATGELKPKPVAYTAVGMQQLYDAVRKHAPENVVLVAGLDWAYDLSGIGKGYAVAGTNIVYDTHVYTQWHSTTADWDEHFGYLTKTHPVSATEFGSIDCTADVTSRLIDYFDAPMGDAANRMSWTIWSWNSPGECSQPTVIADWDGTPLPDQGRLVYERLREMRIAGRSMSP